MCFDLLQETRDPCIDILQETRDLWVDGISHLVLTLRSLSTQKEYELYLKNAFR